MKLILRATFVLFSLFLLGGCEKDDNHVPQNIEVNNFIWKGLNLYYLWQADVPDLSDNRFANQQDLNRYLYGYGDAQDLFTHLLYKPSALFSGDQAVDRFSVLFADYTRLEGLLSGTTKNHGADFALYYKDDTQSQIIGVIRYILPNSDASTKDIHRGDIFYAVNGTVLTPANYQQLLSQNAYTLNLADYDGGAITPNGRSVSLNQTVLSENPVYLTNIIEQGSHRIGYLMYNGFYPAYESALNEAFAQFQSAGITDFVLDLRYNGGGSIQTAARLASMLTGQFTNEVFAKEQWNAKLEAYYQENEPETLYNRFTTTLDNNVSIHSLNLTKMYVLTTRATASASELVINGLKPYIEVVQVGDFTIGKNVGSVTLYDSPSFTKSGASTNHRYAMQPLVLKVVNRDGFGDYIHGLEPQVELRENLGNLGVLGQASEPLLQAAIDQITAGGRRSYTTQRDLQAVRDKRLPAQLRNGMYTQKAMPLLP